MRAHGDPGEIGITCDPGVEGSVLDLVAGQSPGRGTTLPNSRHRPAELMHSTSDHVAWWRAEVLPLSLTAGEMETPSTVAVGFCLTLPSPVRQFRTTPADVATRNANRFDAQASMLGDLGYDVFSAGVPVGGLPFVDGCVDQNRYYGYLGGGGDMSDDYLDPYWSSEFALLDSGMAVLLTESTNMHFALAFFSSTSRNGDPSDNLDRGFRTTRIPTGSATCATTASSCRTPLRTISIRTSRGTCATWTTASSMSCCSAPRT